MRRPASGVTSTAPAPISAYTPTAWVDRRYDGPVSSSAIDVQAVLNVPNISAWYTHDRACGKYTLATQTPQAMAKVPIAARDRPAAASRAGSVEGVGGTPAFQFGIKKVTANMVTSPQREPIMGLVTSSGRRWVWYGGRPSLDFVNTRRNREAGRGDHAAEYLQGPDDFAAWLHAAGLAAGPAGGGPPVAGPPVAGPPVAGSPEAGFLAASSAVDDETFAGALALREAIDSAVTAVVASAPVPERDVGCVNDWIVAGPERPVLRLEAGVPVLCTPRAAGTPRGALALIAADAGDLLGTGLRERLRICPGPGCHGRFLDDSPAGRRRWCSMAVCGNRSKAAAYRQAAHAAPSLTVPPPPDHPRTGMIGVHGASPAGQKLPRSSTGAVGGRKTGRREDR